MTESAYSFDTDLYSRILKKYSYNGKKHGVSMTMVHYKRLTLAFKNPTSDISKLIRGMRTFNPNSLSSDTARIAFWINAYNIGAMKLIAENYPVTSIRSFKINIFRNPWKKNIIMINNKWYSLHFIEHIILLGKYKRLDTHFAIVCASVSCPELARIPYTVKNLNRLINQQAQKFLNDSKKGIKINKSKKIVYVSRIFKYDSKHFNKGKIVIIPFILKYIKNNEVKKYLESESFKIMFLNYNWSLNGW